MPIGNLTFHPVIQSMQAFVAKPLNAVIWAGSKNRLVSCALSAPGLSAIVFTVSFVYGVLVVQNADRRFNPQNISNTHREILEKKLQGTSFSVEDCCLSWRHNFIVERIGAIFFVFLFAGGVVQTIAQDAFNDERAIFSLNAFILGLFLGWQTKEYYSRRSANKINGFFEIIKEKVNQNKNSIDLSKYIEQLRCLDLESVIKRFIRLMSTFSECKIVKKA